MNIDIEQLKGKIDAFNTGDVEVGADSLFGDSLNANGVGKLIAGLADGKLGDDDISAAIAVVAELAIEAYFTPIAMMVLKPTGIIDTIAELLGAQIGPLIPTEMELFPAPLPAAPPNPSANSNPGFGDAKNAMNKEINKLKSEINLDSIQQSEFDDLDNMLPKDDMFDEALEKLEKLVEDPTSLIMEELGIESFDPAQLKVSEVSAILEGAIKEQTAGIKTELSNTIQDNKTLSKQNDFLSMNYQNMFPSVMEKSQGAAVNMLTEKLNKPGNPPEEIERLTKAKAGLSNMNVADVTKGVFDGVEKDEVKMLNDSLNNMNKIKVEIQDVVLEFTKKSSMDSITEVLCNDDRTKKLKELASTGKSLIKILKILKTMTTTLEPVASKVKDMTKGAVQKMVPGLNQTEIQQIAESVQKQMPSDTKILQDNGMDNIQSAASEIMAQMNNIKDR